MDEFKTFGLLFKGQDTVGPCAVISQRSSEDGKEKIIPREVLGLGPVANGHGKHDLQINNVKERIPIELKDGLWIAPEKIKEAALKAKVKKLSSTKQAGQRAQEKDREHER